MAVAANPESPVSFLVEGRLRGSVRPVVMGLYTAESDPQSPFTVPKWPASNAAER